MTASAPKGCHILVMIPQREDSISVGKLGSIPFRASGYTHVRSVLSGLHSRLRRHERRDKRLHRHTDYLLQGAQFMQMICARTTERIERQLTRFLGQHFEGIAGLGTSDCGCGSHLFRAPTVSHIAPVAMKAIHRHGLAPYRR